MKGFGEQLRAARELRGLSQVDLSRLSGLSASYLSMLERSDRVPNAGTCIDLCKALDLMMVVTAQGVTLYQNV